MADVPNGKQSMKKEIWIKLVPDKKVSINKLIKLTGNMVSDSIFIRKNKVESNHISEKIAEWIDEINDIVYKIKKGTTIKTTVKGSVYKKYEKN